MPSSKQKPTTTTRKKSIAPAPRFRPLLIVLCLVLAAGGLAYGLHQRNVRALAADKARFSHAEQDIASLSASIVAATGQPLKITNEKFCSRPSVEIGKGPLSCDVESDLFYGVSDEAEATALFHKVSTITQRKWQRTDVKASNNMLNVSNFDALETNDYLYNRDSQKIIEVYTDAINKMDCRSSYSLYKTSDPPYGNYPNNIKTKLTFAVGIDCNSDAKAEYYPPNN